jgi:uncharacterized protein
VILENEFTVAADIETVWRHLLDMERVAACLPGATVSSTGEENVYEGSMRLKIGPMTVEYRGTATLAEIDEDAHTAVIELRAREARGQGTAMAKIRNRVEQFGDRTRVRAETDLNLTGPQAQFGRGVIEDVGGRVMGEFARRLEQQIAADAEPGAATPQAATAEAEDVLDVGSLVGSALVRRAAGAAVLALALLVLLLRRRRG